MRLSYVHHAHKSRFMTISDACIYTVLSMGCWKLINDAKSVGSWGSAPDPDGGAYSAPPYPLAAIVPLPSLIIHYGHPPHSIRVSAPDPLPFQSGGITVWMCAIIIASSKKVSVCVCVCGVGEGGGALVSCGP